jgi:hypothetical protein
VWARRTHLEKERKEEAKQRVGRLEIIRLQNKVANGETKEAGKWNNTDLKVTDDTVVQTIWGKAMPKSKYGLLLRYRETCTCVVPPVT